KTVQLKYCEVTLLGLDKDVPSTDSNAGILPDCTPEGDKCSITLSAMDTILSPESISTACPNLSGEGYSFRIDTPSVVVFLDSGDRCNIYDDIRIGRGEGVCNSVSFKGQATNPFMAKRFYIIPYNR
ncbi:MAG: hypothetical protein PHW52_05490, partial [Candidatus Pacebacteria bacterium]|nr:hypothetical protein [Candidatus Paceibacterota bacterium]